MAWKHPKNQIELEKRVSSTRFIKMEAEVHVAQMFATGTDDFCCQSTARLFFFLFK